jgi:anti-sigma factor RsiW
MEEREHISECKFSEGLISYLYGEITPADSRKFEAHLGTCQTCCAEFAEFTQVRDRVGEWRTRTLDLVTIAPSWVEPAGPTLQGSAARGETRSAMAALREFFSLSPLWLRGATVAAALIFCALAFFALSRLADNRTVVVNPTRTLPSDSEIAKQVEERALELAGNRKNLANGDAGDLEEREQVASLEPEATSVTPQVARHRIKRQLGLPLNTFSRELATLRSDEVENQRLMSDLGLTAARDEERVPRLSDLLDEPESNE